MAELVTGCPFFPGETDIKQLAIIRAHGGQGRGVRISGAMHGRGFTCGDGCLGFFGVDV